jgi:hypothetical protein
MLINQIKTKKIINAIYEKIHISELFEMPSTLKTQEDK